MTRRGWIIAMLGLVAIAGTGAVAAANGRSTSTIAPLPHWGLYSAASWDVVATKLELRGFAKPSIQLVTGTKLMSTGRPFALLRARSAAGRTCFAVVRGTVPGATICQLSKPLLIFEAPDLCAECSPGGAPLKTLTILALVRRDVQSVTTLDRGHEFDVIISPAGGGTYAFNMGATRNNTVVGARGRGNSILAQVRVRLP